MHKALNVYTQFAGASGVNYKHPISKSVATAQCNQANLSRVAIRMHISVGWLFLSWQEYLRL
jgi:hypothetical protein